MQPEGGRSGHADWTIDRPTREGKEGPHTSGINHIGRKSSVKEKSVGLKLRCL